MAAQMQSWAGWAPLVRLLQLHALGDGAVVCFAPVPLGLLRMSAPAVLNTPADGETNTRLLSCTARVISKVQPLVMLAKALCSCTSPAAPTAAAAAAAAAVVRQVSRDIDGVMFVSGVKTLTFNGLHLIPTWRLGITPPAGVDLFYPVAKPHAACRASCVCTMLSVCEGRVCTMRVCVCGVGGGGGGAGPPTDAAR